MDALDFTASVRAQLARSILLGRCELEIARAQEEINAAPAGRKRLNANWNLAFWLAKQAAAQQGISL